MYQLLKHKNLVYVAVFKCASTYYTGLLAQNNWQHINWADINWNKDTVFGFIGDPLERYCKGLAEDVYNDCTDWNMHNLPIVKDGIILTEHTWPIHMLFGKQVEKIHWLRLTNNLQKNNLLLEKFLSEHDEKIYIYPSETHHSKSEKIEIYNVIKEKLTGNRFILNLIATDKKYFMQSRIA